MSYLKTVRDIPDGITVIGNSFEQVYTCNSISAVQFTLPTKSQLIGLSRVADPNQPWEFDKVGCNNDILFFKDVYRSGGTDAIYSLSGDTYEPALKSNNYIESIVVSTQRQIDNLVVPPINNFIVNFDLCGATISNIAVNQPAKYPTMIKAVDNTLTYSVNFKLPATTPRFSANGNPNEYRFMGWANTPLHGIGSLNSDFVCSGGPDNHISVDRDVTMYALWQHYKTDNTIEYLLPKGVYAFLEGISIDPNFTFGDMPGKINAFGGEYPTLAFKTGQGIIPLEYGGTEISMDDRINRIHSCNGISVTEDAVYIFGTDVNGDACQNKVYDACTFNYDSTIDGYGFSRPDGESAGLVVEIETAQFVSEAVFRFFIDNAVYMPSLKICGYWSLPTDHESYQKLESNALGVSFSVFSHGSYENIVTYNGMFYDHNSYIFYYRGVTNDSFISVLDFPANQYETDKLYVNFGLSKEVPASFYLWLNQYGTDESQNFPEDTAYGGYIGPEIEFDETNITLGNRQGVKTIINQLYTETGEFIAEFLDSIDITDLALPPDQHLYVRSIPINGYSEATSDTIYPQVDLRPPRIELLEDAASQARKLRVYTDAVPKTLLAYVNGKSATSRVTNQDEGFNDSMLITDQMLTEGDNTIYVISQISANSGKSNEITYNHQLFTVVTLSAAKGYVVLDTKEKLCNRNIKVVLVD